MRLTGGARKIDHSILMHRIDRMNRDIHDIFAAMSASMPSHSLPTRVSKVAKSRASKARGDTTHMHQPLTQSMTSDLGAAFGDASGNQSQLTTISDV